MTLFLEARYLPIGRSIQKCISAAFLLQVSENVCTAQLSLDFGDSPIFHEKILTPSILPPPPLIWKDMIALPPPPQKKTKNKNKNTIL